jgi:hypothetical protein
MCSGQTMDSGRIVGSCQVAVVLWSAETSQIDACRGSTEEATPGRIQDMF